MFPAPKQPADAPSKPLALRLRRAACATAMVVIPLALATGSLHAVVAGYRRWVHRVHQQWADAEEQHSRWGPANSADRFVMIEMESRKAESGRYPERPTPTEMKNAGEHVWYYRANTDGSDYELWCAVPRQGEGFDALVFSPDGAIGDDWPGSRPRALQIWTFVERADLAPPERWQHPIQPADSPTGR